MSRRCPIAILSITVLSATIAATLITVGGCGGAADEQAAAVPAVDPRYASAEALVGEYNLIVGEGQGIDARPLVELFYAENDLQRRMIDILAAMIPIFDLDRVMWRRFGTGLNEDGSGGLTGQLSPAHITEETGDRATAVYPEPDGTEGTLMLVKIGERWWLSGFTFEHDPEFEGEEEVATLAEMTEVLAPIAGELAARIERGEFAGAEEARAAVMLAVFQRMNEKEGGLGERPGAEPGQEEEQEQERGRPAFSGG